MYKVSVLIPIYNVEQYLSQCLDSVVNQTLSDIEIICINDGSTDGSGKILSQYAIKDNRIRVITKDNTGYGHSMNVGLKMASGKYIGIVESDDFAEKNMFEILYKIADENQVEVVKSNFFSHYLSGDVLEKYLPDEKCGDMISFSSKGKRRFLELCTPIWSGIYRRDFLLENNIFFTETPGASYQDTAFGIKIMMCVNKIYFCKDAFLHYRRDNMESSVHSLNKVFCICDEFDELWKFIKTRGDILDATKFYLAAEQYDRYMFSYNRIADRHREKFLIRMIEDFKLLSKRNLLNANYWDAEKWLNVQKMIKYPERVLYKNIIEIQSHSLYLAAFFQKIEKFKHIFIYGAGNVGQETISFLRKRNLPVQAFLVSQSNNNLTEIDGVPVKVVDEVEINTDDDLVLIAVAENTQYEIIKSLRKRGIHQMISMSVSLRQALRERRDS